MCAQVLPCRARHELKPRIPSPLIAKLTLQLIVMLPLPLIVMLLLVRTVILPLPLVARLPPPI